MKQLTRSRMRVLATAGAALAIATGVMTAAAAQSSPARVAALGRVAIAGTKPAWATAKSQLRGAAAKVAAGGGTVTATVYLAGQDPSGLAAYAAAVSTPGNARYGHYLSAGQAMARFGPTGAQIGAVEGWLTGAGLRVTGVSDEIGGYVRVSGSVAQAARAFGVTFGAFRGPDTSVDRAPEEAASAPAGLAADVLTVSGLDTARDMMRPQDALPPPGQNYWDAGPCSAYWGQKIATDEPTAYGFYQPWTTCGYTPRQLRSAYGVAFSGMTGKGQTVAVVDAYASPTMLADANEYATATGDQPFRPGQYTQDLAGSWRDTAPKGCDAPSWYGEETLDVEAVHGMAPDANVVYVGAASCTDQDFASALAMIVRQHLASIVTDSWSEPADQASITRVYDTIFEAGATEGIGFFFASGDNGYEDPAYEDGSSNRIQVDYPAASPWVTSVGGTSLAVGMFGNYEFETSWGTLLDPLSRNGRSWADATPGDESLYYDGSSGGGVSTVYSQPWYQRDVVPRSLATALPNGTTSRTPMRVVPDVSADADPSTGMLVGETLYEPNDRTLGFSLSRVGGTSLASAIFAGIEADAQQAARHPIGFANPVIYSLTRTFAFHDVTDHPFGPGYVAMVRDNYTDPYTQAGPQVTWLRTLGIDGQGASALPAVRGYDDATGVGSPASYIQSFEGFRHSPHGHSHRHPPHRH